MRRILKGRTWRIRGNNAGDGSGAGGSDPDLRRRERRGADQLADAATARRLELKVLFTTGYTANAIVHHGMLDPGVNLIGEPLSISALAAKIKSMGF